MFYGASPRTSEFILKVGMTLSIWFQTIVLFPKNHRENDPMYLAGPMVRIWVLLSIINPESTLTKKVHFQVACFVVALLIEAPILQEMSIAERNVFLSREVTHIHSELRGTKIIFLCVSRSKYGQRNG